MFVLAQTSKLLLIIFCMFWVQSDLHSQSLNFHVFSDWLHGQKQVSLNCPTSRMYHKQLLQEFDYLFLMTMVALQCIVPNKKLINI